MSTLPSSIDEDLPSPPPFMKDMLTNVHSDSERVPGSLGDRLGKNRVSFPTAFYFMELI